MVGFCPAFQPKLGVPFAGDGASLFHFASQLDELAERLGIPPLTSFTDDREPPPDFDGFREELAEAIGPWRDWFSATDGLRCVEGLLAALEDPSLRARFSFSCPSPRASGVVDDLVALHDVLVVAKKRRARFRLEIA
jgi:hypothetical protein